MNYLNTNILERLYQDVLNDRIFVDKSMLIHKVSETMNTKSKYICITRPRRFGKTVNAAMLGAYYTKGYDTHQMFDRLKISQTDSYKKHLNRHNVIYIDFSRMPDVCSGYRDYVISIIERLKQDLTEIYPQVSQKKYFALSDMLCDTKDSFIFILDEWDSVFYKTFMSREDKSAYLEFLKGLLKDQPYVELAYMTGILPVAKYSSGSELNMFDEYNFINDNIFDVYFGFNENEVKQLCLKNQTVSYEEMKKWYDGYYLSNGGSLFNPRSVKNALIRGVCLNYWTETGPMNEIADCIEHNADEVREDIVKLVAGILVKIDLKGYSASEQRLESRDDILSAMVVYGFLSYYKGYLRIPNFELMEKFQQVLSRKSMGEVREIVKDSQEMLEATLACEEKKVAAVLERVHDREIPFLKYNDENSLSCVITLCYLAARDRYQIEREQKSGKGYCDYIFIPKENGLPAIILELKVNSSCKAAVQQIKDGNYMQKTQKYSEVLLVGINYDEKKHHECLIEKISTL
ncbi:MAG: ATP-binding protein [Lachnospiraceae bacterium]|nr:ATP-binding protein [Lachnospiraceae bacterium]